MKLLKITANIQVASSCLSSLDREIDDFALKYSTMPDNIRRSLNRVIKYFIDSKEMLNDFNYSNVVEEVEEVEEVEKATFDPSRTLEIMLNPMSNANRFLRYEFMKEQNGIDYEKGSRTANCERGWEKVDGFCWKINRQDLTKLEAKENCMIKNADLVKPNNKLDNRNIADFMWSSDATSCIWLGLNDEQREGRFMFDNSDQTVEYTEFARFARENDDTRNNVYVSYSSAYKPKMRRWNLGGQGKKCNSICVKAPGDRHRQENAISDPLSNVNRFLTLGQLDDFYDLVDRKLRNGERMCDDGWSEVGTGCFKLINELMDKKSLKKKCLEYGASLAKINSEEENDQLLGFLDRMDFRLGGKSEFVWLGMNDGKVETKWVFDNSRPPIYVEWFQWDSQALENNDERNSVILNYKTGNWHPVTALEQAVAVCAKPILFS